MRSNKLGFTLSEVLVSVVVIGVIMAIAVNSIKVVKASYTSLAYFAFNNVQNMVGALYSANDTGVEYDVIEKENDDGSKEKQVSIRNIYKIHLIDENGNELPSIVTQCKNTKGQVIQVLKSDSEYEVEGIPSCSSRGTGTDTEQNLFCKSLAAISNTSGRINCDNLSSIEMNGTEPAISSLDYDNPSFITTNGQRFYISEWKKDFNVSSDYGFRLVAVDLNGTSRPNRIEVNNTGTPPDIVTFMVIDNGEVFPIGVAADNINLPSGRVITYLNSKVKGYYYTYNENRTENVAPECTKVINGVKQQTCNYAIVPLTNEKGTSFFSYRQAYCLASGDRGITYENYCKDIPPSELCPPSTDSHVFDLCLTTNVKPMFRYNFR